jgi:DNA-nicking Smr family endonuclease
MSRTGGKSGDGHRTLTSDETDLWEELTRSIDKAKGKPRVLSGSAPAATVPARSVAAPAKTAPPPKPPLPAPKTHRPAPLAGFDRRTARQIASGKTKIDARLDLHGVRQRDARARLRAFLLEAQASGCRTVLVITGKGGETDTRDPLAEAMGEPQRGALRRGVPQWLEEPDLRPVVLGYMAAGARHGGQGALYVQLRKAPRHE